MSRLSAFVTHAGESYVAKYGNVLKFPSAASLSQFLHAIVVELVKAADLDTEAGGAAKKAEVLAELSSLYDTYAVNIPIPYVPRAFSRIAIAKAKPLVMAVAADLIEVTLAALRGVK